MKLDLSLNNSQNSLLQHLSKIVDDLFGELSDLDLLDFSKIADNLFKKLSNLDLLDFLYMQNLFDIKKIQEFDVILLRLLLQSTDIK